MKRTQLVIGSTVSMCSIVAYSGHHPTQCTFKKIICLVAVKKCSLAGLAFMWTHRTQIKFTLHTVLLAHWLSALVHTCRCACVRSCAYTVCMCTYNVCMCACIWQSTIHLVVLFGDHICVITQSYLSLVLVFCLSLVWVKINTVRTKHMHTQVLFLNQQGAGSAYKQIDL